MPEFEAPQNPMGPEPVLDLLLHNQTLDEPIWKSLFRNVDDFFFPKKLPPLVLTSKPVPVRDIWGFYNYKGRGAVGSTVIHLLAVAAIIAGTYLGKKIVDVAKPTQTVELIAPEDIPALPPSKSLSGGGGGGGDRDKLQLRRVVCPSSLFNRSLHPRRLYATPTRSWESIRRLSSRRRFTCSNPTCPTWAIPCRIYRPCLRMEPDRAAASAPATVVALVPAKVRDSAPATVAAPAAVPTALAGVFLVPKRFISPILSTRRKPARPSFRAPACSGS